MKLNTLLKMQGLKIGSALLMVFAVSILIMLPQECKAVTKKVCLKKCKTLKGTRKKRCVKKCQPKPTVRVPVDMGPFIVHLLDATPNMATFPEVVNFVEANITNLRAGDFNNTYISATQDSSGKYVGKTIRQAAAEIVAGLERTDTRFSTAAAISNLVNKAIDCLQQMEKNKIAGCSFSGIEITQESSEVQKDGDTVSKKSSASLTSY